MNKYMLRLQLNGEQLSLDYQSDFESFDPITEARFRLMKLLQIEDDVLDTDAMRGYD